MGSYVFGKRSLENLRTVHPRVVGVCYEVLRFLDIAIISGMRSEEEQNRLVREGKSWLKFPHSKHNTCPSIAVDVVPFLKGEPCWGDTDESMLEIDLMVDLFKIKSKEAGLELRCGADWKTKDCFHFEFLNLSNFIGLGEATKAQIASYMPTDVLPESK